MEDFFKELLVDGDVGFDLRQRNNAENQAAWEGTRQQRINQHLKTVANQEHFMGGHTVNAQSYSFLKKPAGPARDLHKLQPILASDLQVGKVHKGRVFYCTVATRCSFMKSAMTLVDDADGELANLAVYNYPRVNSLGSAQAVFSEGRRLAIIEPFFKLRADGTPGIRVDEPSEVAFDVEEPKGPLSAGDAAGDPGPPREPPSALELRVGQMLAENPSQGIKGMHKALRAEGFAVTQQRLREVLKASRAVGDAARRHEAAAEPECSAEPEREAGSTEPGPQVLLPPRQPDMNVTFHSDAVAAHRDAGNAAFKAGDFAEAERWYTKALKASKSSKEPAQKAPADADGIPAWVLYSNRSAARMKLNLADRALQDACQAYASAPAGAVKPDFRCAEAMAAMGFRAEAARVLQDLLESGLPEGDRRAAAEKQKSFSPGAVLRVGAGEAFESILAAVLSAPSGAEIRVGAGTYPEPLLITKPVSIRSACRMPDENSPFYAAEEGDVARVVVGGMHAVTVMADGGAVLLEGLQIVNEGAPERCLHAVYANRGVAVLQRCSLTSSSGPILAAENAGTRVIVKKSSVHEGGQGGVLVSDSASAALYNVSCCYAAATGLELRRGGSAYLDGCSIFGNGSQGVIVWHGAGELRAERSEIHSNEFETGVMVMENTRPAILKSCRLYGNGYCGAAVQTLGCMELRTCDVHSNMEGILVQSSGTASIDHCIVKGNRANGVFIGYDHTGEVSVRNTEASHNRGSGILMGAGLNDRTTVSGNHEHSNLGIPCFELPPQFNRQSQAEWMKEIRRHAKETKKSGGGFGKAAAASSLFGSFFPASAASAFDAEADRVFQGAYKDVLACSYCHKQPGEKKFKTCSQCMLASYCSSECQKKHWKDGHKKSCKPAPPKHPSFLNRNVSVDRADT